jgi:hypothetical protein
MDKIVEQAIEVLTGHCPTAGREQHTISAELGQLHGSILNVECVGTVGHVYHSQYSEQQHGHTDNGNAQDHDSVNNQINHS